MNIFDNLTDSGMFFFWIVIFLVVVLFILSVILLKKNKKLKELVDNESFNKENMPPISDNINSEQKNVLNISFDNDVNKDKDIEVRKIESEDKKSDITENKEVEYENKRSDMAIKNEIRAKVEISTPGAYQRNVLREMSRKMPISPIHIEKSNIDEDTSIYTVSNDEDDYDLDEIYLREDSVSPLEEMEDSYEVNDNMKFASEIVSRMEEEMKPSNIELTDYEKKQEEEAIISYDELQKVKDKIYNITEDEETDDFIDELKIFRSDLE